MKAQQPKKGHERHTDMKHARNGDAFASRIDRILRDARRETRRNSR